VLTRYGERGAGLDDNREGQAACELDLRLEVGTLLRDWIHVDRVTTQSRVALTCRATLPHPEWSSVRARVLVSHRRCAAQTRIAFHLPCPKRQVVAIAWAVSPKTMPIHMPSGPNRPLSSQATGN
jgi:hypothetical protein